MSDSTDDTTNNPDTSDNTDDSGDDSLWSNLKNKVVYKIHNVATDPNANKFAAERAKKRKEEEEQKKNLKSGGNSDSTDDTNTDNPNQFSIKRLAKKVGNQTLDILKKVFFPFIGLMLAMIVSNEMIMYSVPIRIIFFIFTFLVCLFVPPFAVLLGIFYCLKGGYSYYVNHMTDRPKQEIMPTIYALLPITTYKPLSSLGSFFLYPFNYPKTDIAAVQLPKTMKQYWQDLVGSFKDFDKVKNLPLFVNDIKKIQEDLSHLHDQKGPLMTFGSKNATSGEVKTNSGQMTAPKNTQPTSVNSSQSVGPQSTNSNVQKTVPVPEVQKSQ